MIKDDKIRAACAAIDAGHCSQSVYLYAAAAGLGVVVRAALDTARLSIVLKLQPGQMVVIGQTLGYEKKQG